MQINETPCYTLYIHDIICGIIHGIIHDIQDGSYTKLVIKLKIRLLWNINYSNV